MIFNGIELYVMKVIKLKTNNLRLVKLLWPWMPILDG